MSDEQKEGGIKDFVLSVLSYIDSPFKLLVVVLLGVLIYAGHFVHENSNFLMAAYQKKHDMPKLNESKFDDISAVVMKEIGADVVAIFSVDPILNKRVLMRVYSREGGREKKLDGTDVGLFTGNEQNNAEVIELMAGRIPCSDYTRPRSEVGLWYSSIGIRYTCRVSVPPDINQFIGQITVGWKEKPHDIDFVKDVLTVASTAIAK